MAEGFFSAYGGDNIEVLSAGLEPGGVNPLAIKVMREVGIDISSHTSNNLNEYLDIEFDYVITVCDNAAKNCPIFPGKALRVHWSILDPASVLKSSSSEKAVTEDEVLQVFRKIRDEIGQKIKAWLKTEK